METKKEIKTSIFIFLMIICGISIPLLYLASVNAKSEVCYYLPQLKNHDLQNIKIEKIYSDPSYSVPYSILISFASESNSIISDLGLKDLETVDTFELKKSSWVEEYNFYFNLNSINGVRTASIKKQIESVEWWQIDQCNKNYAAPYFDSSNKRGTVFFGKKNNGRVVCCKKEGTYFILIECWG